MDKSLGYPKTFKQDKKNKKVKRVIDRGALFGYSGGTFNGKSPIKPEIAIYQ